MDSGDQSLYSADHCCICGKHMQDRRDWLLLCRGIGGSPEFAIAAIDDVTPEEARDYGVWVAPIGSDCLRRHPELQPMLIGSPRSQPVTAKDAMCQHGARGYCPHCDGWPDGPNNTNRQPVTSASIEEAKADLNRALEDYAIHYLNANAHDYLAPMLKARDALITTVRQESTS